MLSIDLKKQKRINRTLFLKLIAINSPNIKIFKYTLYGNFTLNLQINVQTTNTVYILYVNGIFLMTEGQCHSGLKVLRHCAGSPACRVCLRKKKKHKKLKINC